MKELKSGDQLSAAWLNKMARSVNDSSVPSERGGFADGTGSSSPVRTEFRDGALWVQASVVVGNFPAYSVLKLSGGDSSSDQMSLSVGAVSVPDADDVLVTNGPYPLIDGTTGWVTVIGRHRPVLVIVGDASAFGDEVGPNAAGEVDADGFGLKLVTEVNAASRAYALFICKTSTGGDNGGGCGECTTPQFSPRPVTISSGASAATHYRASVLCGELLVITYVHESGDHWVGTADAMTLNCDGDDVTFESYFDGVGTLPGEVILYITDGTDEWTFDNESAWQPGVDLTMRQITGPPLCPCADLKLFLCLSPVTSDVELS